METSLLALGAVGLGAGAAAVVCWIMSRIQAHREEKARWSYVNHDDKPAELDDSPQHRL